MDIYCDGSGWNGRESRACVIQGTRIIVLTDTTEKTNNEMEYEAVLLALSISQPDDIIYTDSQLVVNQLSGDYKCNKPHLQIYIDKIRDYILDRVAKMYSIFPSQASKRCKEIIRWLPDNPADTYLKME